MSAAARTIRAIPEDLRRLQVEASDPAVSAWVTANAGSGKTHVLAQRVIRLLLDGVDPAKILCITFTKAAAANMANRVFDELRRWTALDDVALDAAIKRISNIQPDAARRTYARRLFAAALETPGGLKVQTIHAFCTRLLHQFPFEANVAARFTVLEERAEAELIDKLRLEVLMEAAARPDEALGRALETAITAAADQTFAEAVRETVAKRDVLNAWIAHAGGLAAAIDDLARALCLDPADTSDAVESEILTSPILPSAQWPALIAALVAGSASDRSHAARLEAARNAAGSARVEAYLDIFCTQEGTARKT